jgi:hypothetical protein
MTILKIDHFRLCSFLFLASYICNPFKQIKKFHIKIYDNCIENICTYNFHYIPFRVSIITYMVYNVCKENIFMDIKP